MRWSEAKAGREIREYIKLVAALSEPSDALDICEVLLLRDQIDENVQGPQLGENHLQPVLLADTDLRSKSGTLMNLPAAYWWGREAITIGPWTIRHEPSRERWWWYLDQVPAVDGSGAGRCT